MLCIIGFWWNFQEIMIMGQGTEDHILIMLLVIWDEVDTVE